MLDGWVDGFGEEQVSRELLKIVFVEAVFCCV